MGDKIQEDEAYMFWINRQRNPTECDLHWELKQQFLERNFNSLKKNKLLCFAQLFVNIQTLGCRYSKEIMKEVKCLAGDIGQSYKERGNIQRFFVQASEACRDKVKDGIKVKSNSEEAKVPHYSEFIAGKPLTNYTEPQKPKPSNKRKIDVNPDISSGRTIKFIKTEHSETPLSQDGSSGIHRVCRPKFFSPQQTFNFGNNSPWRFVCKQFVRHLSGKIMRVMTKDLFSHSVETFFKQNNINYDFITDNINGWCLVICRYSCIKLKNEMETHEIGNGSSDTRHQAIEKASNEAFNNLSQICHIIVKSKPCMAIKSDKIDLNKIVSDSGKTKIVSDSGKTKLVGKPLDGDSVGSKMLKMMGWSGGGLGIRNDGIIEPIKAYDSGGITNGIGFQKTCKNLTEQITDLLDKYVNSEVMEDLIFSPDINKQTRADIHFIVRKTKLLSSASRNENGRRYLTVRKYLDVKYLADRLAEEGGQIGSFKLFAPGTIGKDDLI